MEILDKVKALLDIKDTDSTKDDKLDVLIEDAIAEAIDYCNLKEYKTKLDSTVTKMVIQNYNKAKIQGISSQAFSGVTESFIDGYSIDVIAVLNKNRRVRFL